MPAGPGEDALRFAAAVELGRSPGFLGDHELDRDLEIVARLRTRGRSFDPSPTAKALAKQRLLIMLTQPEDDTASLGSLLAPEFPRPADATLSAADSAAADLLRQVSKVRAGAPSTTPATAMPSASMPSAADQVEPAPADVLPVEELVPRAGVEVLTRHASTGAARRPGGRHSMPSRPGGRADDTRPTPGTRRRFGLITSAASVLMIALAGMGMLGSRDALPGQPLYGVKRVAESAGLALTFDDMTKAKRHLQLATTRLDEVEQLVQADPQLPTEQPELVTSAIQEFDDSTGEGARILLGADEANGAVGIRETLRTWAAEQLTRLAQLKPALPASTGADDALQLLDRVVVRTEALQVQSSCEPPTGTVDDLGPVPNCGPNGPGTTGPFSDPALDAAGTPGATDPATDPQLPSSTEQSTSADAPGSSSTKPDSRTKGAPGSSTAPRTSKEEPTRSEAPNAPPEPSTGDPGGALGGGDAGSGEPSTSPTPATSADDDRSNSSGPGLPGLPPVNIPLLPGLPGLSL